MADWGFFGMTAYEAAWYFLIYSFAGWVIEVAFHVVSVGKIINRGFLNGPGCPVYGFGVLSVFAMGYALQGRGDLASIPLWQLFLAGVILSTAVELAAGALLFHLFHARWWDYSKRPVNFHGYICPEFSIIWGLAIAFVVRDLQPAVEKVSAAAIPERVGVPILAVCYAVLLADVTVTVLSVTRLNRELEDLEKIRASMRTVSDGMSRVIGEGTFRAVENIEKGKARLEQEAERGRTQLQQRQEAIAAALQRGRILGTGRILRGVPELSHARFGETLRWLQERMNRSEEEPVSGPENRNTSRDTAHPEG